ncbi:MAG: hypothetical protein EOP83_36555, partial [Verrucomicrobiaceae bacterium]
MTTDDLLEMSKDELDKLFAKSPAGEIPDGETDGTAIIAAGTRFTSAISRIVNHFAWQGKSFKRDKTDPSRSTLRNRLTMLGFEAIVAQVYKGPSLYDGKECIVLDYSDTSTVAGWIRDELRQ